MSGFVVFRLDGLHMAIALACVERVIHAIYVTHLPDAPTIIAGVINLHGQIIPVIDMRRRIGLPQRDIALSDRLVIARTTRRLVALVADSVSGVAEYPDADLIRADSIVPGLDRISGIVRLDDGLIFIHDLDRFLSLDEMESLEAALTANGGP